MISKKNDDGIVQMRKGISRQNLVSGDRTHLVKFFVEKRAAMPTHSHKEEQSGYLIKGRMIMTIDGVDHELGARDSWATLLCFSSRNKVAGFFTPIVTL